VQAASAVDRTLVTENPAFNRTLWKAAGYSRPPKIYEMIVELADYQKQLRGQATDLEARRAPL